MIYLNKRLKQREEEGKFIRVGISGAGQMGKTLVSQLKLAKGMLPSFVVNRNIENALKTYEIAGIPRDEVKIVTKQSQVNEAIEKGKFLVSDEPELLAKADLIDALIEATGYIDYGAKFAHMAIKNKKHVVMLNVEADVTVGNILNEYAKKEGVIYTGSAGDEPGAVMDLYDMADAVGLKILCMGKGKNNAIDMDCNPSTVNDEAVRRGISSKMLASFKDGTKTMVELSAMCNATGFHPDIIGCHGPKTTLKAMTEVLNLKEEGGILNSFETVEYVDGVAPGVFIIVTTDMPQIHHDINYLKVGDGPNYLLFRPFHLCATETPISVARAVLDNYPTIVAMDKFPYADTVTVAKKDLNEGEIIDGIGGYCMYGTIVTHKEAIKNNYLPIGLINDKTRLKTAKKKGEFITYDDVILDENSYALNLRRKQDKLFG